MRKGRTVPAKIGYAILNDGEPRKDSSGSGLRREEFGRLFYPSGYMTVWPTRNAARRAMRRSARAWGDDLTKWSILLVRRARTKPLARAPKGTP